MKVMMKTKDNGTMHRKAKRRHHIPLNISETNDEVRMAFLVPGYTREEIEITLEDGQLSISANIENKERDFLRKEYQKKSFERQLKIPARIDSESMKASLKNGILSLHMKKIQPKKINIQ